MTRWVGLALIVWGLIFQSQAVGAPANLVDHETRAAVSFDSSISSHSNAHEHRTSQDINNTSKAPCHKKATSDDLSSSSHHKGDVNCLGNGTCASLCVLSGVAVNLELMNNPEPQITSVIPAKTIHIGFDFLSRIYHPPKLS